MSTVRTVIAVLLGLATIVGIIWLAGFIFLSINRVNPLDTNLMTWWDYWQAYSADDAVRKQLLMSMLIALGLLTVAAVAVYVKGAMTPLHGESRFANAAEIQAAGLMKSTGIIVGKWSRIFLMFGTLQFVSLLAPTRSGKGVGIVIPNLLNFADSVVVQDVKGENFAITSKYRADNGQDVYCFAPFSTTTHQWNPIAYIPDEPHLRVPEVLSIGHTFYPRVGGGRESMWNDTARDLFVGLVLYLLETPALPASIGEVLRQASGKGKPLKYHLQGIIHARNYDAHTEFNDKDEPITRYTPKAPYDGTGIPHLSDKCVDSLNRFIVAPDNTAGGIMTTFTAPLTLWASPVVDAATTNNDIDLRELRKRRMSVYINIPVNKLDEAGVLLQLFFTQLIKLNTDELLGSSPALKYKCLLVLDEFLAPGYIPIIAKGSAYIAGYGLRMLTIAQSGAQIAAPIQDGGYGREGSRALLDNHALNILYPTKNLQDAQEYSEILGHDTVKSQSRNIRNRWNGTESDQRRALMLPQEIMRMNSKLQIIQLEGVRPIKCKKIRYYEEPVFIDRLKSVSPSLARLGSKLPNQAQLESAWSSGELSAPVPTINIGLFEAKRNNRTREMTPTDIAGGVDLEAVALDLSAIKVPDNSPMTDIDVDHYIDSFWSAIERPAELIDTDTGEVLTPDDAIDLTALQA